MKIIHKLSLGFLLIILLIWIFGYFAISTSQQALQTSIGEDSASLAVEVLNKMDRLIYDRIEIFQVYSKDLILQRGVAESN